MALDLEDDFDIFDNPVTVTYKKRNNDDTFTTVASNILAIARERPTATFSTSLGVMQHNPLVFHIKFSDLAGTAPALRDTITLGSAIYQVNSFKLQTLTFRYRFECDLL